MRKIEIVDDLRLCFPGQPAEFDAGLELGALAVLMAQGIPRISRQISRETLDALRPIAEHFRYMLADQRAEADTIEITLLLRTGRPKLRLVQAG